MHGGSSGSLVDERPTTQAEIGAWLRSAGALFARNSWRHRAMPHAVPCRKEHAGKNCSPKMSRMMDGRGTLSDTFFCFASMLSLCQWDSYCWEREEKQFIQAEELSNSFWDNLPFSEAESCGQSGAQRGSGRALFTDYLLISSQGYFMENGSMLCSTQGCLKYYTKWIMGRIMT